MTAARDYGRRLVGGVVRTISSSRRRDDDGANITNVDAALPNGATTLFLASKLGLVDTVQVLLKHGTVDEGVWYRQTYCQYM